MALYLRQKENDILVPLLQLWTPLKLITNPRTNCAISHTHNIVNNFAQQTCLGTLPLYCFYFRIHYVEGGQEMNQDIQYPQLRSGQSTSGKYALMEEAKLDERR